MIGSEKIDSVKPLTDLSAVGAHEMISSESFGVKTSSLYNTESLLKYIPEGFALAKGLVTRIALSLASYEELNTLRASYSKLSNQGKKNIIVRSSSTLEWLDDNSFAGLFASVRGIQNFEELIEGIKVSYSSTQENSLQDYAALKSIALPEEHLGILIQEEVDVKYSALVVIDQQIDFIEYYGGDIVKSIQGQEQPVLTIERLNGKTNKKGKSLGGKIPKGIQQGVLSIVDDVRKSLSINQTVHLEIGSDGENYFLFQVNYLPNQNLSNFLRKTSGNAFPESLNKNYPLKAEAMSAFKKIGLFPGELKIYRGLNVETLVDSITNDFSFEDGITIRYSFGDDISMPRGFFKNKSEAQDWVNKTYTSPDWLVIVHPYIEVRRSFELLLDKNECLLEHIPGMWESDNDFNPDVIFLDDSFSKAWVWKKRRTPLKGIFNANLEHYESPLTENEIVKWQHKLKKSIKNLRAEFHDLLPLNFHFVENDKAEWSFLNMRKGFDLTIPDMIQKKTHLLRNNRDVLSWDGVSPLQMQLKSERGCEEEIIEIIQSLPRIKDQVILVDFGLLSHPAMILREFGYRLIPSYLYHTNGEYSPNYSTIEFDINSDPINRIMKEKSLYEDEEFKVVVDRDEIVKGHLLVVAKRPFTSLVEVNGISGKLRQIMQELKHNGLVEAHSIIVERGRARFCTSGFTDSHAHAHILPIKMFCDGSENLFIERSQVKKIESIEAAVEIAKCSDNEYLMLIDGMGDTYLRILPDNISVEKQLIRNFFKEHTKID